MKFAAAIRLFTNQSRERSPRATAIVDDETFAKLGIADTGPLVLSAHARPLVITVDADLTGELARRELPFVNLNHCVEGWALD